MLVTFEGSEGSGKSSIVSSLETDFGYRDDFIFTVEPNPQFESEQILREKLQDDDADPVTLFYLFMANHITHMESVVKPALEAGKVVFSDRYYDSCFVYQSMELEGKLDEDLTTESVMSELYRIQNMGSYQVEPDLTILLDVTPETSISRCSTRNSSERYDRLQTLQEVVKRYRELARTEDRFTIVSSEQEYTDMYNQCCKVLCENGILTETELESL
jgi:dTMP kinase